MLQSPETARKDTAALTAALVASGQIPAGCTLTALSGGRTNRLWRISGAPDDLVVKLYAKTPDNPLFSNDPEAEAKILKYLDKTGFAPRLQASLSTPLGPVLLYTHVPGTPWRSDPAQVARALARLHAHPAPSGLPRAPDGTAALVRQTLDILRLCTGPIAARLRNLAPQGTVAPSGVTQLLHGDTVPGNLINAPHGITFIDWQCPALGDSVHDLAVFLSPAMQLVYRGSPLSPEEESRFLAAYHQSETTARYHALAPWFHWRMAAYCLWRADHGATEYQAAVALECDRLPF